MVQANQITASAGTMGTSRLRRRGSARGTLGPWYGFLFIAPAGLLFGVFVLTPMVTAFSYAFFHWSGTARLNFGWFDNFITLFSQDPYNNQVPAALVHNLLIFVGSFVGQNTLGLGIALLLYRLKWGRRLFQTLYTLPYLVSAVVVGYLWGNLLSPLFGPINNFLKSVGLGAFALSWLGDPNIALWTIVFVIVWQWIGFPILLYGAALGGLPEEIQEAAACDGASAWRRFWSITLPLLTPAIGTVSVLAFIAAMEAFSLPFALGGGYLGSPAGATDVLSLVFYRIAFQSGSGDAIGVSSALATLMFVVIFAVAIMATKILRRREEQLT